MARTHPVEDSKLNDLRLSFGKICLLSEPRARPNDDMYIKSSPPALILSAPFAPSRHWESHDRGATIIDTFAPKPGSFDSSPTSSAGSDLDGYLSGALFDAFLATKSRVVRVRLADEQSRSRTANVTAQLYDLPFSASTFLAHNVRVCSLTWHNRSDLSSRCAQMQPISLWVLREDYIGPRPKEDSIWAIFGSHEEVSRSHHSELSNSSLSHLGFKITFLRLATCTALGYRCRVSKKCSALDT
jgi:hypothetical protein